MKKITHFAMLALLISLLFACSSDGNGITPSGTHTQNESAIKVDSESATATTNGEPESFTLVTDNGVGVTNNQNTEKPTNH